MSDTLPDQLLLNALDFDISCACLGCVKVASWWLVCKACESHTPWCDDCRTSILGGRSWRRRVSCHHCLETVQIRRFWVLFTVLPIGVRQ